MMGVEMGCSGAANTVADWLAVEGHTTGTSGDKIRKPPFWDAALLV